jgi:beta-glucosidase
MMCANNRINQQYSCENAHAVQDLLRGVVGFQGWMLSDYMATRSTIAAALNGLDMQMPGCSKPDSKDPLQCDSDTTRPNYFGEPLLEAVLNGSVPLSTLQDKVIRIVRAQILSGVFNRTQPPGATANANVTSAEHNRLAFQLALRGLVLLKNQDALLPLRPASLSRVAVLGAAARDAPITGGGGSGAVTPYYQSTVYAGIAHALAAAGAHTTVMYSDGSDVAEAVQLATQADVAIVVVAATSSEGSDRTTLDLQQAALAQAVAQAQSRTVVVAVSPGQFVAEPWLEPTAALVYAGMSGQEQGNAIAALLFNTTDCQAMACPCGRLPFTVPTTMNQVNFTASQYPGINHQANCKEWGGEEEVERRA